ncbi:putative 2-succinyl-6-hydroxy-2,4-cyclohexadiene-1-carboxylate synthase [Lysinibacillus piscis]|uniref:Putative 2-succinyl-6-hydroxy-2,4-cyclohexadiene-1-carboxylate synthase n=2 Tax=Lysinibacillus piscis TaxID=2518931 RepID=A0ABQ5NJ92_9BACI|nr:putative 2-succinyl-6-hydroxy-2,4-cyclohexadiene-1-carboxylate synthase [Lysinibacillus sp. KH24]
MVRGLETAIEVWNAEASQTIVALHGFTGSTTTWQTLAKAMPNVRVIAIDLIGHGQTAIPEQSNRFSMEEQIQDLEAIFQQLSLEHFTLLGYSMGGRIALSYTLAYPTRVVQLLLESASPGLKTAEERLQRRQQDARLADMILQYGVEVFVEEWENIALFASQKRLSAQKQQIIRAERLAQRKEGLAGSLRGIGTGNQPSNWETLGQLVCPVLLITGSLDRKFCSIATEMCRALPNGKHVIINDVGHAIHVENPDNFATIVMKHMNEEVNK